MSGQVGTRYWTGCLWSPLIRQLKSHLTTCCVCTLALPLWCGCTVAWDAVPKQLWLSNQWWTPAFRFFYQWLLWVEISFEFWHSYCNLRGNLFVIYLSYRLHLPDKQILYCQQKVGQHSHAGAWALKPTFFQWGKEGHCNSGNYFIFWALDYVMKSQTEIFGFWPKPLTNRGIEK